jgi:hypothetical protein
MPYGKTAFMAFFKNNLIFTISYLIILLTFNISKLFFLVNIYFQHIRFFKSFRNMAHNVPAVYDGLPARIRACEARPGLANCAGVRRGNEVKRNDLAERKPSPPTAGAAYTVLLGAVQPVFYFIYFMPHNFSF